MADIGTILAGAKRPERTLELCLRSDLTAAVEDAQRRLKEERGRARESLADGGNVDELRAELERIKTEAADHTVVFRFRALNHYEIDTMVRDLPPREGNAQDKAVGYNLAALTWHMFRKCCYEPEMTDEQVEQLIGPVDRVGDGVLSPSQFKRLDETLDALNFAATDVPF